MVEIHRILLVYITDLGKCGKSSRMPKKVKGNIFQNGEKHMGRYQNIEPNIIEMIPVQMKVGGMRQ